MKVEMRDPADLRLHALRRTAGAHLETQGDWNAFVDGISGAGLEGIPAIFITQDGRIMDGARRHQAARQLAWREIACVVRPEEECAVLMFESLMGQRNLTKGAKVYIALGFLKEFVESAEHRRLSNIKKGAKTLEKPLSTQLSTQLTPAGAGATAAGAASKRRVDGLRALAERFGCSHELVAQAMELRRRLADSDTTSESKAFWEGKIFDPLHPVGIGAAIAGLEGGRSDQDHFQENKQLDLFTGAVETLWKRFGYWSGFDEAKRREAMKEIRDRVIAELEPDQAHDMAEFLTTLAAEARKRSKHNQKEAA